MNRASAAGSGPIPACVSIPEASRAALGYCIYNNQVHVAFDPAKRAKTLADRGLDFSDAAVVFAGVTLEFEDTRRNYGETRMICFGRPAGRIVVVGYAPRATRHAPRVASRHVFSMRKANEREQARVAPLLEV